MRRAAALLVLFAVTGALSGCGGSSSTSNTTSSEAAKGSCAKSSLQLVNGPKLTVGTDNPAFPPWFGGTPHSPWKVSDPRSGEGYESAVAYAVAKELGFAKDEVQWIVVPFATSFAPGPKKFDFNINQISYKPERAKAVDFSSSYYNVSQAVVGHKGEPIAKATTVADLKPYKLGVQLGTTSYDTIVNVIKPTHKPAVYDTNDAAVQALKNKQIDGLVVDLPTAFYVTAVQVPNSTIVGQIQTMGTPEHFGLVLAKGSSLTHCVDDALVRLRASGTLAALDQKWLAKVGGAPVLK